MVNQQDRLTNIGLEGFDLIDKIYDAPNRRHNPTGRRLLGVPNAHEYHNEEEGVIDSKEAAYKYKGIMVIDFHKTKPQHKGRGKMFNNFEF